MVVRWLAIMRSLIVCLLVFCMQPGRAFPMQASDTLPNLNHGWQQVQMGPSEWDAMEGAGDVVFHHGVLLATGSGVYEPGNARPIVWRSTDGYAWQESDPGFQVDRVLPWRNGFVAVGRTISCDDIFPGQASRCALPGNQYVKPHALSAVTSDGLSWNQSPLQPSLRAGEMLGVAASRGVLVGIGGTKIWRSFDGLTWQNVPMSRRTFPKGTYVANIVHWNSGFVATGYVVRTTSSTGHVATIWLSSDGTKWQRVWQDRSADGGREGISRVMSHGSLLVAWGPTDYGGSSGGTTLWTSTDGMRWHRVRSAVLSTARIAQIVSSPMGYIAVGYPAGLRISQDAVHWVRATSDTTFVGYPYVYKGTTLPARASTEGVTATPTGLVVVGYGESRKPDGPTTIATAWVWSFPPSQH